MYHLDQKYLINLLQPLVTILPSYIQESKHFLQLIESVLPLPENAIATDVT